VIDPFSHRLEKLVADFLAEFGSPAEILTARREAAESMRKLAEEMFEADADDDGQPSEEEEWHDFDPDC
jgi:hypothetical protein